MVNWIKVIKGIVIYLLCEASILDRAFDLQVGPLIWSLKDSLILPSEMDAAPHPSTVDITQNTRLFKNTRETEKIQKQYKHNKLEDALVINLYVQYRDSR